MFHKRKRVIHRSSYEANGLILCENCKNRYKLKLKWERDGGGREGGKIRPLKHEPGSYSCICTVMFQFLNRARR